jgi:hypothetical protein
MQVIAFQAGQLLFLVNLLRQPKPNSRLESGRLSTLTIGNFYFLAFVSNCKALIRKTILIVGKSIQATPRNY